MSVTSQWYNDDKTIVHVKFAEHWTWEDFYVAHEENLKKLNSVNYRLGFIVDLQETRGIPSGALGQIKRVADVDHPNNGLTVCVGLSPMLRALASTFVRVYPFSASKFPVDFAKTLEEAEAKLKKWRENL